MAVTQGKHLLFLFFDLFCRFLWIFPPSVVFVDFIGTMKSVKLSRFFFSFSSVTFFYCYHKPLPLHWAFAVLWSFPLFLFSIFLILIFNFLNLLFFLYLFPCLLFLLFFSPCSWSLTYRNLLYLPLFNFAYLFFLSFLSLLSSQHIC